MATIAALIVAYHSADEVEGLAESLRASTGGHLVDIDVLDNSMDPAEVSRLASMPGIHRFIASEVNLGYGAGMNALEDAITSNYDWLLVCNPDIRFEPQALDELVAAAERHESAALFGPRIIGIDGAIYPSARAFPRIRVGVGHALFANLWPSNPWTRRYHRGGGGAATTDTPVDWLSGACLLVRPSSFRLVGGFDDGYFMYFEDVDLSQRLSHAGFERIYVPTATVVHEGAHSTSKNASAMLRVHHESAYRYLAKRYRGWWNAPLRLVLRVALTIRSRIAR